MCIRDRAYTEALDLVEDKAGEAWDQEIEGKTGYEWVHDKALQAVKNYAAVEEKFEELGYTLAEEQEAYAENQATQRYNYYSGLYEANGISSDSVVAIYMNQMKSSVIFQNTYAPGGTQGLSVDELKMCIRDSQGAGASGHHPLGRQKVQQDSDDPGGSCLCRGH